MSEIKISCDKCEINSHVVGVEFDINVFYSGELGKHAIEIVCPKCEEYKIFYGEVISTKERKRGQ